MKAVRVCDLDVDLGSVKALRGVDIGFEAGRALMLVGPNGAGKSTLMKVLLGLVRPDRGRIEVDGKLTSVDNAWKRHIGYLPEAVAFSENLSGRQLLGFFAHARGVDRAHIEATLERVGLTNAARRSIRGYSRGMRQRLGLAVSILSTPDLLILDEPTSGLDQEGLTVLWSVLDEWRDAGRMVLISSHDLALMERRIDDICVLRAGTVVAQGTADELRDLTQLPHRVSLELVKQMDEATRSSAEGLQDAIVEMAQGDVQRLDDRLVCEVPQAAILELISMQARFPGVVTGVRVEEPTLDVVYDALLRFER